ncbi:DUF4232 domain-containing protein [Streptomyces oryzae]|uniref:DUF4232 domain-containing protein n=1 Tax=Streptomyces oryzae TaxID=1434886 RepID=A0ABS3X5H4_9ACTN|nr:DUF4232 domain-containing protein [Streptomyces oryzae]MBO8190618.1 DUF4232 domain-containing protein [Streptomyces oryzae]
MRARKLTLAALALTAGLSLTACQGSSDSNAGKDTSKSSSPDSSSSSSSTSSGGNSGGTGGSNASDKDGTKTNGAKANSAQGSGGGDVTTGTCKTSNLEFHTAHGMADGQLRVAMKNTGEACSLKGFPGADLQSQDIGHPLSAKRSDKAAPDVTLQNGETTRFTISYPENNTGETGYFITSLVVTPPNETHSKNLSVGFDIPAGTDADEITVDPVGTGKQ